MNTITLFARLAVVVAGVTYATSAQGQAVTRLSNAAIDEALVTSGNSESRGVRFSTSADNDAQFLLNRRTSASEVELHCEWDDLLVVRAGVGVLRYGRKVRGLERYGWHEWRASELVSPTDVELRPGDLVRVPAGEAHMIQPLGDVPLVYIVIKVRSFDDAPCGDLASKLPKSNR